MTNLSTTLPWRLLFEVLFSRLHTRALILLCSMGASLFGLAAPLLQKEFIDVLTNSSTSLQIISGAVSALNTPHTGLLLAGLSFICILIGLGLSQLATYLGARESIHMQRQLGQRLYDHALSLRADSLQSRPIGEIVAIYATDIPGATVFLEQSLPTGANIIFPLIFAPLAISFLFHIPVSSIILTISLISALNFFMAYRQSKYFFNFKKLAADRIGLVNEWIQNIRTLRILGWVQAFESHIISTREVETQNRVAMVTNGQAMNSLASSVTYLLNLVVIFSWVHGSAKELTAGGLFALLWIAGIFLTRSFRQMPWLFTFIFDAWTSLKRVDTFLKLQNFNQIERHLEFQKIKEAGPRHPALLVQNLNLNIGATEILKSIDLSIKKGEFVAIVGEVGCGKSLLLLSLMGETGATFSQYKIGENDARNIPLHQLRQFFTFVPQEGFIMSSSLRDNVAFQYHAERSIDRQVLHSLEKAQFKLNNERIESGLDTEIGERGVNLSGGQKQRVSLARVDFHKSPIVLMDDCLSALDVDTEDLLIESLLRGSWKDCTRILVTHRLTVLDVVDRVIFMEQGRIVAEGKFADLLNTNPRFRQYTASITVAGTASTAPSEVPS